MNYKKGEGAMFTYPDPNPESRLSSSEIKLENQTACSSTRTATDMDGTLPH